jgi:aminoglycoside phosphotransferase (APT) family kinase protein
VSQGTTLPDEIPQLAPRVVDWIETISGGGSATVTPFGHYRPLWSVDVVRPDATVELFVRGARDSGSVLASVYNLEREAAVIRALTEVGVPTPPYVGYEPDEQLLVLERVPGRGDFHNLDDAALRERVAHRFVEVLADLHRRDPRSFGLEALMEIPTSAEQHALGELAIAEALYDAQDLSPEPVMTFCRRWLRDNVPTSVEHTSFIQGDTGPGNFVFHDDDVWLVDLEISHFGDPMEDLAAVCIRDMVTPFGDLRELFAEYEALTDWPLDLDRVRYHRVSKCVRSLMAIVSLAELGHQRGELLTWLAYRALYVRSACQALAEAMGMEVDALRDSTITAPVTPSSSLVPVIGLVEADLRDLAASSHDDEAAAVLARDLQATAVLRIADAHEAEFRAVERAELEQLLESPVESNEEGLRRLDEAIREDTLKCADVELLRFLTTRADRQCVLMRPIMGAMADGHFSPIE